MVTADNSAEITRFIRPRIAKSANVLLVGSNSASTADQACQNLLTTASERTERAIAIEYTSGERTWVDRLTYVPSNLQRVPIYEGNSLPAQTRTFVEGLGEKESGIVYVDSLSALASDFGVEDTIRWVDETTQVISKTGSVGFFRIDPNIANPELFEEFVEYTATYMPAKEGWQISSTE